MPAIDLTVELIAVDRENRPGTLIRPTFVTVHNTDNEDAGADAKAHSGFVRNTGYYMLNGQKHWVSWHVTVDDDVAIQHLPLNELGYHAGSGNSKSVAIEICVNRGIDQAKANDRAALLVATLMQRLSIPLDKVVTHKHWTGKKCPSRLLNGGDEGAIWSAFKEQVRRHAATIVISPTNVPFAISSVPMSGTVDPQKGTVVDPQAGNDLDHDAVREQLKAHIKT